MANETEDTLQAVYDADDCLIGAILIESSGCTREVINEVANLIEPSEFENPLNANIFKAMLRCEGAPHQINTARQMLDMHLLEKGAISHMSYCISITPCSLDYLDYAEAVKHYSEIRTGKKRIIYRGAQ